MKKMKDLMFGDGKGESDGEKWLIVLH